MTRILYALLGLWLVACAVLALRGFQHKPDTSEAALNALRDRVRADSIEAHRADSVGRVRLDSLRARLKAADSAQVARIAWRVIRKTDTLELELDTVEVPGPVQIIREGTDSLASCRQARDSLARKAQAAPLYEAMAKEAQRIEDQHTPVVQDAPSRVAWAAGGFVGGVIVTAGTAIAIIIGGK